MSNCKNGVCAVDGTFKPRKPAPAKLNNDVQEQELKIALAKLDNADNNSQANQSTRLCLSAVAAGLLILAFAPVAKANPAQKQAQTNKSAFVQKIRAEKLLVPAFARVFIENKAVKTAKK